MLGKHHSYISARMQRRGTIFMTDENKTKRSSGGGWFSSPLVCAVAIVAVAAVIVCFANADSDDSSAAEYESYECGDSLMGHYFNSSKTLKITGTGGTMEDFDLDMSPHPWPNDVKIIDMSDATNMTNIGDYAFYGFTDLKKVIFGPAFSTMGEWAFSYDDEIEYSFFWHNGDIFDDAISTAEMAGRTFQWKEETSLWMTDVKVGDPLILGDTFKGTITEVYSESSCSVRIDGFMPGESLLPSGILKIGTNTNIWTNKGSYGYGATATYYSIGENAFADLTDLKNLDVGYNNMSIGAGAFRGCTNLKELTVNINVDLSTGKPFEGCANIEKITFAEGIGDTGGKGFDYGSALSSALYKNTPMWISKDKLSTVDLAPGIEKIGKFTFYECKELKTITLPDDLTEVGDYAFCQSGLTSVSTPQNLERIGSYAFAYCKSLASADLKGNGLHIVDHAFYECGSLASLTLGEGVKGMGSLSFAYTGVSVVKLPDSASLLSGDVFMSCPNFSKFEVNDSNTKYDVDEKGALYSEDGKTLVAAPCKLPGIYAVQDGTIKIGVGAFRGCQLSGVVLPSSTATVGSYAFNLCRDLRFVEAPGAKDIKSNAFSYVEKLKEFYAPSLETVAPDAFTGGATFWLGTREIACGSDDFKHIGFWSGEWDGKLHNGAEVSGIRYQKSLADGESGIAVEAVSCGDLKDVIIPDAVTIGTTAYRVTCIDGLVSYMVNEASVETLSLGANVKDFSTVDLCEMLSLKSISVSQYNSMYASYDGLLYTKDMKILIGCPVDRAFPVEFASSLISIGDLAFCNCRNTSGIVLPMGLKNIGSGAFGHYENSVIGSFTLPSTLESIDSGAFAYKFYSGDTVLDDVADIRGHSWMFSGTGYIIGISVPEPVDGNISFDAPYVFDLNSSAIESINGSSVTVTMDSGTVVFSAEAAAGLTAGTLTIGSADTSGYSDRLRALIGDRPVFAVNFGDNKEFAGKVRVSFAYDLRDGEGADGVYVVFVNTETGELENMGGSWSGGYATFETAHFSDYAVMYSEPSDSDDGGSNALLLVGIGIVAAIAVLFVALYFLHIGPFARKD